MKKNQKGFSLIELIVVIVIMVILAAVAVPVYSSYITRANEAVDREYLEEIRRAIVVITADPNELVADGELHIYLGEETTSENGILLQNGQLVAADGEHDNYASLLSQVQEIVPIRALKGEYTSIVYQINGPSVELKINDTVADENP